MLPKPLKTSEIELLQTIIADPERLEAFIKNDPAEFLKVLKLLTSSSESNKALAARALTTIMPSPLQNNDLPASYYLISTDHHDFHYPREFLKLVQRCSQEDQINILSGHMVLQGLLENSSGSAARDAANIIMNFPAEQQHRPLAAANAVMAMTDLGHGKWVLDRLLAEPLDRQKMILEHGYGVIGDLIGAGFGDEMWELITEEGRFSNDEKAVFLIHAVKPFADEGHAEDLIHMISSFTPDQIVRLFGGNEEAQALTGLAENGYGIEALEIIDALPDAQQQELVSSYSMYDSIKNIADLKNFVLKYAPAGNTQAAAPAAAM